MRVNYAIVFVSDMARSMAFYRDVLEIPLTFESPGWSEFATDGATLALHQSQDARPDADEPATEPPGRCRPGFQVADLDKFHQRMVDHAVPCAQAPTMVFGAKVAQYLDPDGLPFSVAEVPSAGSAR